MEWVEFKRNMSINASAGYLFIIGIIIGKQLLLKVTDRVSLLMYSLEKMGIIVSASSFFLFPIIILREAISDIVFLRLLMKS
jgi:hypothetical protein